MLPRILKAPMSPSASPSVASLSPSFADLGVPSDIVDVLDGSGITSPFPIQAMTLPDALAGRDVCGKAPTGSGKTLAFGIGAVARLDGPPAQPKRPRVLVLTPTRELASQVASELQVLASARKLRVSCFYGGVGYGPQLKDLSRGVDVAVACPGRLGDLIERGSIRLDAVEVVVLDEADRMADMGFLPDVKRLLDKTPEGRQTLLFSATLDGDIDVLVRRYQKDPARHELEVDEDDKGTAVHLFWRVSSGDRLERTAEIVSAAGPTIVFTRTKHGADRVARQLEQQGIRAVAIHGDRSQKQRERALDAFVRGAADALVATDVAARGIHVDGVRAVVHFDPPADPKDFVHRSGRTARAGATGVVVTLVTADKTGAVKRLQRDLFMPVGTVEPSTKSIIDVLGPTPPRRTVTPRVESDDDRRGGGHRGRRDGDRSGPPRGRRPGGPRGAGDAGGVKRRNGVGPNKPRSAESSDRPVRSDRDDRPVRSERGDRPVRSDRDDRPTRSGGSDGRPGKRSTTSQPGKPGKFSGSAKPGKPGKPGAPSKASRPGKPFKSSKPGGPSGSGGGARPGAPAKKGRSGAPSSPSARRGGGAGSRPSNGSSSGGHRSR